MGTIAFCAFLAYKAVSLTGIPSAVVAGVVAGVGTTVGVPRNNIISATNALQWPALFLSAETFHVANCNMAIAKSLLDYARKGTWEKPVVTLPTIDQLVSRFDMDPHGGYHVHFQI